MQKHQISNIAYHSGRVCNKLQQIAEPAGNIKPADKKCNLIHRTQLIKPARAVKEFKYKYS